MTFYFLLGFVFVFICLQTWSLHKEGSKNKFNEKEFLRMLYVQL